MGGRLVNARSRSLAHLALALFFGAAILAGSAHDAPPIIRVAAAWGMGASMVTSAVWWGRTR